MTPYDMRNGWPECPWRDDGSVGWARRGCVDYSVISVETCEAANGTWMRRAQTQVECEAHGSACRDKRFWGFSSKSEEDCEACEGRYEPLYEWHAGRWNVGRMRELHWRAREWASINTWNRTLNWTEFHEQLDGAVGAMMARQMKSQFQCRYNRHAAGLERLACDCSNATSAERREQCYARAEFVPLADVDLFSGLTQTVEWQGFKALSRNDTVPPSEDVLRMEVAASGDLVTALEQAKALLEEPERKRRAVRSLGERAGEGDYAVVLNAHGDVVGQLVGAGVSIDVGDEPLPNPIELCLERDYEVPLDDESYPIPDFAIRNDSGHFAAMGAEATVDGTRLCADVAESGQYFPAYRMDNHTQVRDYFFLFSGSGMIQRRLIVDIRRPALLPPKALSFSAQDMSCFLSLILCLSGSRHPEQKHT